jgi:hypothetical protein
MNKVEQYFNTPAISQSLLKSVLANEKLGKSSGSMRKGSLLDTLTTCPLEFDNLYVVKEMPYISETIFKVFNRMIEAEVTLDDKDKVLEICSDLDYYKGKSTALTELAKHQEAFNLSLENKGKEIITEKVYLENKRIAEELNSWVYFDPEYSQLPVYGKLNGYIYKDFSCKGLLDNLSLENNMITDLKRTDVRINEFSMIAKKFDYPFQAAFYVDLVKAHYGVDVEFQWLVYSSADNKIALFKADPGDLDVKRYGKDYHKGYLQALDIYQYCIDNNLDDWDKEYHQNKGIYNLKLYR